LGLINVAKVSDSNGFALTNAKALDFHREIQIGRESPQKRLPLAARQRDRLIFGGKIGY
jgi:maleate cis-trans isomerase